MKYRRDCSLVGKRPGASRAGYRYRDFIVSERRGSVALCGWNRGRGPGLACMIGDTRHFSLDLFAYFIFYYFIFLTTRCRCRRRCLGIDIFELQSDRQCRLLGTWSQPGSNSLERLELRGGLVEQLIHATPLTIMLFSIRPVQLLFAS